MSLPHFFGFVLVVCHCQGHFFEASHRPELISEMIGPASRAHISPIHPRGRPGSSDVVVCKG